jgi:hypothetical protein
LNVQWIHLIYINYYIWFNWDLPNQEIIYLTLKPPGWIPSDLYYKKVTSPGVIDVFFTNTSEEAAADDICLGRHQRAMQNAVTFECPMDSSDIYQLLYLVQLGSSKSGNYLFDLEVPLVMHQIFTIKRSHHRE